MECIVLPVTILKRRCSGSRHRYRHLSEEVLGDWKNLVTVVVGREKREFLVDSFVLEETPFRVLIDLLRKQNKGRIEQDGNGGKRVLHVDVDAILFEHMLWLVHNDSNSLFQLNLHEILEFYAQDY